MATGAREFAATHVLRLPQLLGSDVLAPLLARLPAARFVSRVEHGVEVEETLSDLNCEASLLLPLNDPALFVAIDRLTGCGPIGCFSGRIYRRRATAAGHYYPWHSDVTQDRLVGLSVNLSRDPFSGGELQLRSADTHEPLARVAHQDVGAGVLFRISPALEHHVTPVTSPQPRLVLAGWFRRRPQFWQQLRNEERRTKD